VRNIKNVAPQNQNAICKTRAQYATRNCAFELFIAHCAATIMPRTQVFTKNFLAKKRNFNFINKILLNPNKLGQGRK
jgi:hypothetical protein